MCDDVTWLDGARTWGWRRQKQQTRRLACFPRHVRCTSKAPLGVYTSSRAQPVFCWLKQTFQNRKKKTRRSTNFAALATRIYTYTHTHKHTSSAWCVCTYTQTHSRVRIYTNTHSSAWCVCTHTHTLIRVCIYTHMHYIAAHTQTTARLRCRYPERVRFRAPTAADG